MADLSVFILTFNERIHIERCIRSAQQCAKQVFVVDSGSTDGTQAIAESLGAKVFFHAWENNHARQTNWAIANLPFETEWQMRIDADECFTPELAAELNATLQALPTTINGIVLKRRQRFLGRVIRWGGNYPIYLLRGFRRGQGRCEERWMDEHLVINGGGTHVVIHDLEDDNQNDLRWWTEKQANYAVREAADVLLRERQNLDSTAPQDESSRRKRWLKAQLYARLPPFVRPLPYFVLRYIVRLGFLDGVEGLIWHVLQAFWYRFLVDAIIFDMRRRAKKAQRPAIDVMRDLYQLKL